MLTDYDNMCAFFLGMFVSYAGLVAMIEHAKKLK